MGDLALRYHPTSSAQYTDKQLYKMDQEYRTTDHSRWVHQSNRISHHVDFTAILCGTSRYLCSSTVHWQKTQELSSWTSNTTYSGEHPLGALNNPVQTLPLTAADAQARCPSAISQVGRRVWTSLQSDSWNQALHCSIQRSSCQGSSRQEKCPLL